MQALLTTGGQVIHVVKFDPDRWGRLFYGVNVVFVTVEVGFLLHDGGVSRNKDLCAGLMEAIRETQGGRLKCILPLYGLCIFLVLSDITVSTIDSHRNRGVEFLRRKYIRPAWLTWKVTFHWTWIRYLCCLTGTLIWLLSVILLEEVVIAGFGRDVAQGGSADSRYVTLDNEWSYGQGVPFGAAVVGILFSFRGWLIQPGRIVRNPGTASGGVSGTGAGDRGQRRYSEGWLHCAARTWLNEYATGISRPVSRAVCPPLSLLRDEMLTARSSAGGERWTECAGEDQEMDCLVWVLDVSTVYG